MRLSTWIHLLASLCCLAFTVAMPSLLAGPAAVFAPGGPRQLKAQGIMPADDIVRLGAPIDESNGVRPDERPT